MTEAEIRVGTVYKCHPHYIREVTKIELDYRKTEGFVVTYKWRFPVDGDKWRGTNSGPLRWFASNARSVIGNKPS